MLNGRGDISLNLGLVSSKQMYHFKVTSRCWGCYEFDITWQDTELIGVSLGGVENKHSMFWLDAKLLEQGCIGHVLAPHYLILRCSLFGVTIVLILLVLPPAAMKLLASTRLSVERKGSRTCHS